MPIMMPSQVVAIIGELFPHTRGVGNGNLDPAQTIAFYSITELVKQIPPQLLAIPARMHADLILAVGVIETTKQLALSNLHVEMPSVGGRDAVAVILEVLEQCPDEYPPPETHDLAFVADPAQRESIRRDVGAVERALNNAEWKAATVLAGSTIEALLHWAVSSPHFTADQIEAAAQTAVGSGKLDQRPPKLLDKWVLQQFVEVAGVLKVITSETAIAANLARHFRNLIHPGVVVRMSMVCDRGTAYSAVGGLEHVIRDLAKWATP